MWAARAVCAFRGDIVLLFLWDRELQLLLLTTVMLERTWIPRSTHGIHVRVNINLLPLKILALKSISRSNP